MGPQNERLTYGQTGVDVGIEAKGARILFDASRQTWQNRAGKFGEVVTPIEEFSGLRYYKIENLPKGTVESGGMDGIATKAEIIERSDNFSTAGIDLIAMVADDAVVRGGEPFEVKNALSVNTLGRNDDRLYYLRELGKGLVEGARQAGVMVLNGEIAQLNDRVGRMDRFSLDWMATCNWVANETRTFKGNEIKEGDWLVALAEPGPRCNGLSLYRFVFRREYAEDWGETMFDGKRLIDHLLTPSKIYSLAIVDMFGGWNLDRDPKAELHGVAHITGGGIPEKLGRTLKPSGLGAEITDPFEPPNFTKHCQELGQISDEESYNALNMGQGMILITPEPDKVGNVAQAHGFEPKVIGKITSQKGIRIHSKGLNGGVLLF